MLYVSETVSRRDLLLRVAAGAAGLTLSSMGVSAVAASRQQGLTALQEGVLIGGHAEEAGAQDVRKLTRAECCLRGPGWRRRWRPPTISS